MNQPDFNVAATALHTAGTELAKCANLPAIQQGEALMIMIQQSEDRIMAQLQTMSDQQSARFQTLEDRIETRFQTIENQLQAFGAQLHTLENRFQTLEDRIENRFQTLEDRIENRFQTLEEQLQAFRAQLQAVEAQMQTLEETFGAQLQTLTNRIEGLSTRLLAIENNSFVRAHNRFAGNSSDPIMPLYDVRNELIDPFPSSAWTLDRLRGQDFDVILRALGVRLDGTVSEKRKRVRLLAGLSMT